MTRIALIGCTGSVGLQVAETVRRNREEFCFSALVSHRDGEGLSALAREFSPRVARLAEEPFEGLFEDCDVAFIAAGGFSGLSYTLAAARAGKKIALANKESLVCGGELVLREAKAHGAELVPVDSEHSALFQALAFHRNAPFARLVLTASGGPFLRCTKEELAFVTAERALAHPTWKMGKKVTVDSATLLNKGYEVIEARWLYGAPFEKIEAVVHPESVVHSIVCFEDGAALAQLAYPDMKLPIQLALTYPGRLPCLKQLDFETLGALTFERLPKEKFPCYGLALSAGKAGGTCPTLLNGGAEAAVRAFLEGRITFPQIAETVESVLLRLPREEAKDFGTLKEADQRARACATEYIYGL